MERCLACEMLVGMPSTVQPHTNLERLGTGIFGTPRKPVKHYVQYRCKTCGAWLHQNTRQGSPAGMWSACESSVPAVAIREDLVPGLDWKSAAEAASPRRLR